MWTCPCGSQNEEDALACVDCGMERGVEESTEESYPSALREIEKAQQELEDSTRSTEKEPIPTPSPTPIPRPTPTRVPATRETGHEERLGLDVEEPEQSVYEDIEHLGKELGEVPVAPAHEAEAETYEDSYYEEEEEGSAAKKVLRILDISIVCIIIVSVAIYAIIQIGGVEEKAFSAYLSRCLGIWIRSIIVTQAVLIIGGIFYFLLWEPKTTKAR